jgi:hypothetical protein
LLLLQPEQVSASSHCHPLSLSYLLTIDGLRHALEEGRRSLTARQRCCCCCNLSRYLPALTAILTISENNNHIQKGREGTDQKREGKKNHSMVLNTKSEKTQR